MIVTIDGPAGAGKSSIARQLAARLDFAFLDTGAMYRTVALAGLRENCNWNVPDELAEIASRCKITSRFETDSQKTHVFLNGEDVSEEIRTPEVTRVTRYAADNTQVRHQLIFLQQQFAQQQMQSGRGVVTEGRDQGTLVFPEARCKIFLTATPEERARRRVIDFSRQGKNVSLDEVLQQQNQRDQQDTSRTLGALKKADDAVEVLTDGMSPEQVIEKLISIIQQK